MKNLRVVTAITAFFYAALGAGGAFFGLFLAELGATYIQVSLLFALFILVSICANALYARIADRMGSRRAWLMGGMLIQAVGYLLLARSHSLPQAAGARIIEGVGAAAYATVSLAIVGDLLKDSPRKGQQMGVYRGMGSVTYAIGALAGGLLADRAGLRATILVGAGCLAAGAALAPLLTAGPRPRPDLTSSLGAVAESATPAAPLRPRTSLPRLYLAGNVLLMAALSAASAMLPLYLDHLGRSRATIGSLASLSAVLEFPAMYLTGMLSDIIGRAPLLAAGALAIAGVQILYIAAARFNAALIGAQFTRAFGFASYTANAMTYTAELSTAADRAANSGLFNLAQSTGQLLGLLLGGSLVQFFGFRALFVACAVIALAAAAAFLVHRRSARAVRAAVPESP